MIGIILLVAAMTLSAVNLSVSGDRVRGAARQVQSYLEGARTRAIYGGNVKPDGGRYQCGVRFILDPNNPALVSSMQYVEVNPDSASITGGTYELRRVDDVNNTTLMPPPDGVPDSDDVLRMVSTGGTNWYVRMQAGLIYDYQFVLLGSRKYQIRTTYLTASNEELRLTTPYQGTVIPMPAIVAVDSATTASSLPYSLLLAPQPMANQEPRILGNGVVIQLLQSKGLGYFASTPHRIDIMFSPRGTVVGPLSATGIVEFVVSDREDALLNAPLSSSLWQASTNYAIGQAVVPSAGRNGFIYQLTGPAGGGMSAGTEPTWPTTANATVSDAGLTWTCLRSTDGCTSARRERLIVSLTPQTGMTAVHPVYVSGTLEDADPFRYSETGEVARQ